MLRPDTHRHRTGRRGNDKTPAAQRCVHPGAIADIHRRATDEGGNEPRGRPVIDLVRSADLLEASTIEYGDPITNRHGFGLVMGDEQRGRPQATQQGHDLHPKLNPQLRIKPRHGFIEQDNLRPGGQRPPDGNPLPLAA